MKETRNSDTEFDDNSDSDIFDRYGGPDFCSQERDSEFDRLLKAGKVKDLNGVFAKCAEDMYSFETDDEGSDFAADFQGFMDSGVETIWIGIISSIQKLVNRT